MSTMEDLNAQYVKAVKIADTLRQYEGKIKAEMDSRGQTDTSKAVNSASLLQGLTREIDCSDYGLMRDTVQISSQYTNCLNAINTYKTILMKSGDGGASAVFSALDQIRQAQGKYDSLKAAFLQKYNFNVDSVKALNQIILTSIRKSQSKAQGDVERIKDQAKELIQYIALGLDLEDIIGVLHLKSDSDLQNALLVSLHGIISRLRSGSKCAQRHGQNHA